jgi:flavorubredoxin
MLLHRMLSSPQDITSAIVLAPLSWYFKTRKQRNLAMQKNILIVCHTPSPNTQLLADALSRGAKSYACNEQLVRSISPLKAKAEDVLACDGIILGTTENFGYMSGALKDFFDRIYYPCLEKKPGLPYALMVRAALDGTGAIASSEKIISGLKWKAIQMPLLCHGQFRAQEHEQLCEELGLLMAAGLDAGIF